MGYGSCEAHPDRPVADVCAGCRAGLCEDCFVGGGDDALCMRCLAIGSPMRRRWRHAGIAGGAAVLAALVLGLWASDRTSLARRTHYGPQADELLRLQTLWERTPCDDVLGARLTDGLLDAGLSLEAVDVAGKLARDCPAGLEALTRLYFVYHRVGDLTGAVRAADRLIAFAPWRAEGYAYRGIAHEAAGQLGEATLDYTEALALAPRLLDVPMNLANVLERQGRYCEAVEPLGQALSFYPALENRFDLDRRIRRLRSLGRCEAEHLATDEVRVPFDRKDEVIVVDAQLNGAATARFILDTGASSVVVSRELAQRLGIDAARGKASPVYVQTAGGVVDAYPATLREVRVAGATVRDLPVLVCDTMGEDVDGLLGISFLSRFQVGIDHQRGVVSLRAPRASQFTAGDALNDVE